MTEVKELKQIETVAGVPLEIEINGTPYRASPLNIRDQGVIRQHIRAQAMLAYEESLKAMDASSLPSIMERRTQRAAILNKFISDDEMVAWLNTLEGMLFWLHLSISKEHPKVTVEEVEGWMLNPETLEAFADTVAKLSGWTAPEKEKSDSGEAKREEG